jgi:hypothetical protein
MTITLKQALSAYAERVIELAGAPGSTEPSYCPAIERLLDALLRPRHRHDRHTDAAHGNGFGRSFLCMVDGAFF